MTKKKTEEIKKEVGELPKNIPADDPAQMQKKRELSAAYTEAQRTEAAARHGGLEIEAARRAKAQELQVQQETEETFQKQQEIKETLPLRRELLEGVQQPTDLTPAPLFEGLFGSTGGRSSAELAEMQRQGTSPFSEEQNERRKIMGISAVALGTALGLGVAAAPYLATKFATGISAKIVTAKSAYIGGTALTLGAGIFGFGKLTDFERADIQVQKSIIAGIISTGERIEAMNRNGMPAVDSIRDIEGENANINRAEEIIRRKGELNLKYRTSGEYMDIMASIQDARRALLRRTDAVINTAATGSAQMNPEILAAQADELLAYAKDPLNEDLI